MASGWSRLRQRLAQTPASHLWKMAAVALLLLAAAFYLGDRYRLGHDPQSHRSLPSSVFLVDRYNRSVEAGEFAAFRAGDLHEEAQPGRVFVKRIQAGPGASYRIAEGTVYVQGEAVGSVLAGALAFEKPVCAFRTEGVVPETAYWMAGTSSDSFDSRYFGPVPKDHIVGQATPIY